MPTSKEELLRRGLQPHDIQHNQHRRAEWQDYHGTGLYMVTLCIEGRQRLFGHLEGDIRAQRTSEAFPHIVLSPLGHAVMEEELPKIHRLYPQIELWKASIMPDHLHLLFYIRRPLPSGKHLGHIISSFKGGCSRAWWAMQQAQETSARTTVGTTANAPPSRPPLFEGGYHDRIIRRPGMLENIKRYMADNPLRAMIRQQLPHLMERRLHLRVGTHDFAAFGALFLLKRAEKEQVFYHRRDKNTGVSKGESLVIHAAIDEGLPVIQLQKETIGQYWKPERHRFEACARGSLLILYPWELDKEQTDYDRFHRLNDLAAEICASTDATLMDVGGILEPNNPEKGV